MMIRRDVNIENGIEHAVVFDLEIRRVWTETDGVEDPGSRRPFTDDENGLADARIATGNQATIEDRLRSFLALPSPTATQIRQAVRALVRLQLRELQEAEDII
jgi:hypothetical protein